jgi:hypothetical protein
LPLVTNCRGDVFSETKRPFPSERNLQGKLPYY